MVFDKGLERSADAIAKMIALHTQFEYGVGDVWRKEFKEAGIGSLCIMFGFQRNLFR
ncbi:hypothetical protein N9134_00780 [Akkermansiaceae bacterium]|nr:hypothetical protein [Akkermansiaceae bacterium]